VPEMDGRPVAKCD